MVLKIGDQAPAFAAKSSLERTVRLDDYRGKWLVLYFYPKSFTPGCTRQAQNFRDNYADLQAMGIQVVGVSNDEVGVQCEFGRATGATFPLVADEGGRITRDYGVKWPLIPLAKRVTFIIDPQGKVSAIFHHELQVLKHLDDVIGFFKLHPVGAVTA